MDIQKNFQAVLGVTTMLLLGACANGPAPTNPTGDALPQTSDDTTQYGVVQSIAQVEQQPGQPSGVYKFTVRMSDGNNQVIPQSTNVGIRVGDRVLLDNGVLRRY